MSKNRTVSYAATQVVDNIDRLTYEEMKQLASYVQHMVDTNTTPDTRVRSIPVTDLADYILGGIQNYRECETFEGE